ncbi:jg3665 [Pararge aegeria aegeria]|uniref:Jg3665 protein n=1 Tax=Pararge aegeria aegeria TaxID=348720 RepID=A0A8S4S8F0_9NEOP|nr:jg3665 [Pararge aegeria aegeria]
MTASFVVIGTKKMFNTGYEQYLPIERILIHPNYSGWTADLALVHTFAGMISDKPGQVVPLATERTSTPVDADVLVFSWGKNDDVTVPFKSDTKATTVFKEEITSETNKFEELNNYNLTNITFRKRSNKRIRFRLKKNRKKDINKYEAVTRAREQSKRVFYKDKPTSSIEENNV